MKKLDEFCDSVGAISLQLHYNKDIHCSYNKSTKLFNVFSNQGHQAMFIGPNILGNNLLEIKFIGRNLPSFKEFALVSFYWYNKLC